MTKPTHTKFAILGLLTSGCRTGYSIKQMIDESLNHFWKISYGQIYPTLKNLVEENLVTVNKLSEPGKPDKKEYDLTLQGWHALEDWIKSPIEELPIEKNELLLKLFFSHHQSKDSTTKQIDHYLSKLHERFSTYEAIEQMITHTYGEKEDAKFWLITLDYGKRTTQAAIEWANETKMKL
ncbi:MAG: PadR family transcriptional regulator [Anaerobacillus sp.]